MSTPGIIYTPPETVKRFIRHHLPGELFYDWVLGPVGSGKTTGIFFKLVYMASLQEKSPRDGIRRSRAVIVRNTYPQLKDTTISSFNYWFKDGQAGTWRAADNKFILRFADVECEVLFRALDTPDDVARVLSLEVTFAILDEFVQINEEVVQALSARVGRYPSKIDGGATNWGMWGASNPGNEDSWWYDYLYGNDPIRTVTCPLSWTMDSLHSQQQLSGVNSVIFEQPSGFLDTAENIENLPGGQEYYTNQAKGKPERWIKQFIECQWGFSQSGRPVWAMFNSSLHVSSRTLLPNPHLPLVVSLDPGMNSALLVGQNDLHGRALVYDEIITSGMGAERVISERLKPLLRTKYPNFKPIIAPDPAAANRSQTDERSVVDVYRKHFDVKYDTDNTLPPRLAAVEHFMCKLTEVGPALLIDPSCKILIRALAGGYRYNIDNKGREAPLPEKNEFSHPADSLQYLCKHFLREYNKDLRRKTSAFKPPVFNNGYNLR